MSNKLGQLIGVVEHNFSVTNNAGVEVKGLKVNIDFSTATDIEIKSWLCSNRGIAGQRPWRALSEKELKELSGKTFNACTIGTKVKSRDEQKQDLINTFVNAGLPLEKATELALAALDNPEALTIVNKA